MSTPLWRRSKKAPMRVRVQRAGRRPSTSRCVSRTWGAIYSVPIWDRPSLNSHGQAVPVGTLALVDGTEGSLDDLPPAAPAHLLICVPFLSSGRGVTLCTPVCGKCAEPTAGREVVELERGRHDKVLQGGRKPFLEFSRSWGVGIENSGSVTQTSRSQASRRQSGLSLRHAGHR